MGLESRTSLPISEGVAVVSVVLFKKMGREFWRNDGETDSAINALRMQSGGMDGTCRNGREAGPGSITARRSGPCPDVARTW